MRWLTALVDEIEKKQPEGEVLVSSGVSPSGTYHLGTLREVLTAEAIARELRRRGRQSRHIHIADDLDVFRKVPKGIPETFEKYLGMPLCDVPAPDGSEQSYADYYLKDLLIAAEDLKLEMEVMRAHQKYRSGFFVPAIEKALEHVEVIKKDLEEISGRKLDEQWSPVQIIEDGYLKNRQFVRIDTDKKEVVYIDKDGQEQAAAYNTGNVKLSWRIDWPARWWLLGVNAEPFGRDHATKGGSYDTGKAIVRDVFGAEAPIPVPYNFINRTGDTKKMSKSAGDTVTAADLLQVLPAEIVWFFLLRSSPDKLMFFDQGPTLIRLFDEFSELLAKPDKTDEEKLLIALSQHNITTQTVSNVPFSHLVASYQASLRNPEKTLEVIARTEHKSNVETQREIILEELRFIDNWLEKWAPEDVKFTLQNNIDTSKFSDTERQYFAALAEKIEKAPQDADGEWFHKTVYEFKDELSLEPKQLFVSLYRVLIGKDSGPRAGWFLSLLPRDWLIARLRLQDV
jgi:lysyl-tRNA synthetase class 1